MSTNLPRWQLHWRWHVWGVAVILKRGCLGVHIGPLQICRVTPEAKSYAMQLEDEVDRLEQKLREANDEIITLKRGGPAT